MSQTYPMYAFAGYCHARRFIGSLYILLQLEAMVSKVTLEENLKERKSRAYGTI